MTSRIQTPLRLWLAILLFLEGFGSVTFFGLGDGDVPVSALYCNNEKYSRDYHPELKKYIGYTLEQLHLNTPDSSNNPVKFQLTYPPNSPLLYASSFCDKSSMFACQHCLQAAKKELLHGCKGAIGGQFYSETCFMRFELYDFFTTTN